MNTATIIFEPFVLRALAAGIGIALVSGVLGCFVVWRRIAYFGDSLAHNALLGVALGLVLGISTNIGIIIICTIFTLLLIWLQQKNILATDTLLGIMAHSGLSIGMVIISLLNQRIDLHAYLFGDILTVTTNQLIWVYIGSTIVFTLLASNWSSLVLITIHKDLAIAENINAFAKNILLMFLMTIVVAIAIRIVGILLITSMLIIPAATARQFSRSPEKMAIYATLIGIISIVLGIYNSILFDTPTGPSIITTSSILFTLVLFIFAVRTNKN